MCEMMMIRMMMMMMNDFAFYKYSNSFSSLPVEVMQPWLNGHCPSGCYQIMSR